MLISGAWELFYKLLTNVLALLPPCPTDSTDWAGAVGSLYGVAMSVDQAFPVTEVAYFLGLMGSFYLALSTVNLVLWIYHQAWGSS